MSTLFAEKILNPNWYVRDLYFFKRSQYPQLRLIEMRVTESFNALQKQELIKKFVEIGKVHLTWAILKNVDMVVQRVVFLHEELMKLPSFPRKALECCHQVAAAAAAARSCAQSACPHAQTGSLRGGPLVAACLQYSLQ